MIEVNGNQLLLNGSTFIPVGWNSVACNYAPVYDTASQYQEAFNEFMTGATCQAMLNWNTNTVRFQVDQNALADMATSASYISNIIQPVVQVAREFGFAVILCMHYLDSSHHDTFPTSDTYTAWANLVPYFGQDQMVMFELFNEIITTDADWYTGEDWLDTMQSIIFTIRSTQVLGSTETAQNVVIAGGASKNTSFLDYSASNMLTGANIAYAIHPYPFATTMAGSANWYNYWTWLTAYAPVIATEWYNTDVTIVDTIVPEFLAWMLYNRIGVLGWVFDNLVDTNQMVSQFIAKDGTWSFLSTTAGQPFQDWANSLATYKILSLTTTPSENSLILNDTLNQVNPGTVVPEDGFTVPAGLSAYYNFNEDTGDFIYNINSPTNLQGQWYGTLGSQWTTGKIGSAGNFNGTDNYIDIGPIPGMDGTQFTWTGWVKPSGNVSGMECFLSGAYYASDSNYSFGASSGNSLFLQFLDSNSSSTYNVTLAPAALTANTWNYVTFTLDNSSGSNVVVQIYINGFLGINYSDTGASAQSLDQPYYVMGTYDGTTGFFNGAMDEVAIYDRILAQSEITALYNAGGGKSYMGANPSLPIIRPDVQIYIDGVQQSNMNTYRITNSLDQVSRSATIELSSPASNDGKIDYQSAVKIVENGVVVFHGLIDDLSRQRTPEYSLSIDAIDWLGRVQNIQLDLEGWVFGAAPDNNNNLVTGQGAQLEKALDILLKAAGVPSASIALDPYTGLYGASSAYLIGSVVPYYASQTGYWDMIQEMLVYNGWTMYADLQGIVRWKYFSPNPSSASANATNVWNFTEGDPGINGYQELDYGRNCQYVYNRIEVIGVDASGVYDENGHQCAQVTAVAQAAAPTLLNGYSVIPDNPFNPNVDPDTGRQYQGYYPLIVSSNAIDIPDVAEFVAERMLSELNAIQETLEIVTLPQSGMDIGDVIFVNESNNGQVFSDEGLSIIHEEILSNGLIISDYGTLSLGSSSFFPLGWNSVACLYTPNNPYPGSSNYIIGYDKNGNPLYVPASESGPHEYYSMTPYTAAFNQWNAGYTAQAMQEWNTNIVRFQIVQNIITDPVNGPGYIAQIEQTVGIAISYGFMVLLSMQNNLPEPQGLRRGPFINQITCASPISFETYNNGSGDYWLHTDPNQVSYNSVTASTNTCTAWASIASSTLGTNNRVMFELYNEPRAIDTGHFLEWTARNQAAVNVIRNSGASNVIVAMGAHDAPNHEGGNFNFDHASENVLLSDPMYEAAPQIMYSLHKYDPNFNLAGITQDWGAVQYVVNLLYSEWYSKQSNDSHKFLAYLRRQNAGFIIWVFDHIGDQGSELISIKWDPKDMLTDNPSPWTWTPITAHGGDKVKDFMNWIPYNAPQTSNPGPYIGNNYLAGGWVVREVDNERTEKEHKYTIQCVRGSWGDARYVG